MTDGPLIVQCDKTLLLEVDHARRRGLPQGDRAVRRAGARPRARPHLPAHPARPVERPRRRPRRRAGRRRAARATPATPCRTRCSSTSPRRWPATAGCGWRSTPTHGLVLTTHRPAGARGGAARQEDRSRCSASAIDDDTVVVHPSERGHLKQALLKLGWPAEDLAGYVDGEAHPIDARRGRLDAAALPARGGRGVLARRLRRRRAALRRRQDARRRGRDGAGQGDHADPGHQHRLAPGSGSDELLQRTSLTEDEIGEYSGAAQGDPAGHHRHLPGADHQAGRASTPTSSCSTPATGA